MIVDDVVAELQFHSLPCGLGEYHFGLASQDDVDDSGDESVDMGTWGRMCLVVNEEGLELPLPTGADDTFDLTVVLLDFYSSDGWSFLPPPLTLLMTSGSSILSWRKGGRSVQASSVILWDDYHPSLSVVSLHLISLSSTMMPPTLPTRSRHPFLQ